MREILELTALIAFVVTVTALLIAGVIDLLLRDAQGERSKRLRGPISRNS
jgi:hypothetical protein